MPARGRRPSGGGERGAVSTLFAIFLVTGVFLGALALAVDVGQVVLERRLLQNGADAAALAAAQLCSDDRIMCADGQSLGLEISAALDDGVLEGADLTVCGPHLGQGCPEPEVTDIRSCPADHLGAPNYVEVHLESTVATIFGAAAGGEPVASPRACARASWGPSAIPDRTALPLAISECAWSAATGGMPGGTGPPVYQPGPSGETPGYGPLNPWPEAEIALTADGQADCPVLPDGTIGGGFVTLEAADGCEAEIIRGLGGQLWVEVADVVVPSCDDDDAFRHGEVVHVPVVGLADSRADRYEVLGMAAFYLAGWNFTDGAGNGFEEPSLLTGAAPCFVEPVVEAPPDSHPDPEDEGGEETGSEAGDETDPDPGLENEQPSDDEEDMGVEDPQAVACLAGWFVHQVEPRAVIDASRTDHYGIIAIQLTG